MIDRKPIGSRRHALLTAAALIFAGAVLMSAPTMAQSSADLHLETLTAEQKAFIDDTAKLRRFGLTKEKLYTILAGRDADEVQITIAAMMDTVEKAKYQPVAEPEPADGIPQLLNPAGDMGAVPLNPDAPNPNAATTVRPAILDEYQREPGPFSLKRYMYEEDGIPTFAGAPVALRKEDLVAGKVEVAFVGVPLGLSSGWRDSKNAPSVMRAMYGMAGYDIYGGVDPAVELTLADYGNLNVDNMSVEMSMKHVRAMIGEMADAGTVPFIVGGDHSIMFPTVAAMSDKYGADNVGVVHLDAHYNGERDLAHYYSDAQAVSRLLEEGVVKGRNVVQVGIRGGELTEDDLKWVRQQGVTVHSMAEVEAKGWDKVVDATLAQVRGGPKNIFVSFDISVLDPAYASAAGRPAAGGLTMREAIPMVRRICAETNVVGFEMLDVAPYLDLSYASALNANTIMHACLTGIALRKKGLTRAAYLSPLTSGGK
ncbi:MAG: formiminoglutamase [Sphingomonadales bacterium]|nr:MAG: formiminoglutamase [Sphingomonadales bacterium]TNF03392.1 MAG: formiminoglutamase [Sphingomonadales bacterium]